jgi:hypothetical protein
MNLLAMESEHMVTGVMKTFINQNRHSGNASDPDATGGSPACLGQEGLSENACTDYGASARWIGNQDRQQSSDRELP